MANRKSYTGFPTSHQPRFYEASNFLKMGIKYLNLSSFIQASTIKDEKSAAEFYYIKTVSGKVVAQSIAIRVVSIYLQGTTLPPEILAPSDLTPPEGSEFWHILPCSASTVRDRKRSSITQQELDTSFPTSHQPRFYAAPNFLKMGIKYLNLSSFGQFRQ